MAIALVVILAIPVFSFAVSGNFDKITSTINSVIGGPIAAVPTDGPGGDPTPAPTAGDEPTPCSQDAITPCVVWPPSPIHPLPNSPVTVDGVGFCPDTSVQAFWDSVVIGDPITASWDGRVSITFTPTVAQSGEPGSSHEVTLEGDTTACGGDTSQSPPRAIVEGGLQGGTIIDNFNRADTGVGMGVGGTTPASGYSWSGFGFKVAKHELSALDGSDNNYPEQTLVAPLPFPFRLNIDITGGLEWNGAGFWAGASLNGGYTIKVGYLDGAWIITNWSAPGCTGDYNTAIVLSDSSGTLVSCTSGKITSPPTNLNMVVTATSVSALGITLALPAGISSANNPTVASASSGGGSADFDNLYISGDLYGVVPPSLDYPAFSGSISLTRAAELDQFGRIVLTATASSDVADTTDSIDIIGPDGGANSSCGAGTTCEMTMYPLWLGQPSESYHAIVVGPDGTVRATSETVTILTPVARTISGNVTGASTIPGWVYVYAYTTADNLTDSQYLNGGESYSFTLPAGTYKLGVFFWPTDSYPPVWYGGTDYASATSVDITSNNATIDITLP